MKSNSDFSVFYLDFEISCAIRFLEALAGRSDLNPQEKDLLFEMIEVIRALPVQSPKREFSVALGCDELGGDPWYFIVEITPQKFELNGKCGDCPNIRLIYSDDGTMAANYFDNFDFLSAGEDMLGDCHYGALESNTSYFQQCSRDDSYAFELVVDGKRFRSLGFYIYKHAVASGN